MAVAFNSRLAHHFRSSPRVMVHFFLSLQMHIKHPRLNVPDFLQSSNFPSIIIRTAAGSVLRACVKGVGPEHVRKKHFSLLHAELRYKLDHDTTNFQIV